MCHNILLYHDATNNEKIKKKKKDQKINKVFYSIKACNS